MNVTFFADHGASTLSTADMTLQELRALILKTTVRTKDKLPWLKLATFGDKRTKENSLRHNANVEAITGIELDYDAEKMSFDEAVAIVQQARLTALVYTSPSHTSAKPRWRIMLPTSRDLPPVERKKLVARVNGLFGGTERVNDFETAQCGI